MKDTAQQYRHAIASCKDIFIKKIKDYGTSWRVLRTISIADQLFIKAQRIRNIQELGTQKVDDNIENEFRGIVNYGIIGLIQLQLPENDDTYEMPLATAEHLYDEKVKEAYRLMQNKNHDYGEAWRDMSQASFADLILVKVLRIKQILQNKGKTLISEGIEANYADIINYAVFALIQLEEQKNTNHG